MQLMWHNQITFIQYKEYFYTYNCKIKYFSCIIIICTYFAKIRMYDLTLYFKTSSKEDFFNFPMVSLTKQMTQTLITNLTSSPPNIFHIFYIDHQGDQVTLATEDDYLLAKEYAFDNEKVASIFVVTDQKVKFAFQEDYKFQTSKQKEQISYNKHQQNLTTEEMIKMDKVEKKLNRKEKRQKNKEEKKYNYKKKIQVVKNQLPQVFQANFLKNKSSNSLKLVQDIKIENSHLESFQIGPKIQNSSLPKQQNDPSFAQKRKVSNLAKYQQIEKQLLKSFSLPQSKNTETVIKKVETKQFDQEDRQQQDSQPSYEFEIMSKQSEEIDHHSKLKQQIISQLLALLPKFIKAECLKDRLEVDVPRIDLLPTCFNCKKHLKPKQLRKMEKKRAYEQKRKESAPLNQSNFQPYEKQIETKKS